MNNKSKKWHVPLQKETQSRRQRSAGKVMLVIFWDEDGVLLTDYLTGRETIDGSYYTFS
jgi:hypothetical protein